jgi:hypothetical protein
MKTIFENEFIRVESTGKDYDFIATIENKTDKKIRIRYSPMDFDVIYDTIDIEPNDWVGLLADKEGHDLVRKFELGQIDVEVLEKERENKMKNTKTTYASNKAVARQEAIDWQNDLFRDNRSYEELAEAAEHFEKLGKRYGLLKEFRENGIC